MQQIPKYEVSTRQKSKTNFKFRLISLKLRPIKLFNWKLSYQSRVHGDFLGSLLGRVPRTKKRVKVWSFANLAIWIFSIPIRCKNWAEKLLTLSWAHSGYFAPTAAIRTYFHSPTSVVSFRRTTQISIIWDGSEKGNEGRWGAIQTFGLSLQQPLPRENSGVAGR